MPIVGTAVGAAAADQLIWNVLNPLEPGFAAAYPDSIIEMSKSAKDANTQRCGAVVVVEVI